MQRIQAEYQQTYCKNCHQPLIVSIKAIHESYCGMNTPPCSQCANSMSICKDCHRQMPPCQFPNHLSNCALKKRKQQYELKREIGVKGLIDKRIRLNIFQTVCPYCKKQSNVNDILKHIDTCVMRKDRKVLSENVGRIGRIIRSTDRQDSTSIQKIRSQKDLLPRKMHVHLGLRNSRDRERLSDYSKRENYKYPYTEQVIPIDEEDNNDINSIMDTNMKDNKQKDLFQIRILTPIPLFLKTGTEKIDILSSIQTVSSDRQNIGKLAKNI